MQGLLPLLFTYGLIQFPLLSMGVLLDSSDPKARVPHIYILMQTPAMKKIYILVRVHITKHEKGKRKINPFVLHHLFHIVLSCSRNYFSLNIFLLSAHFIYIAYGTRLIKSFRMKQSSFHLPVQWLKGFSMDFFLILVHFKIPCSSVTCTYITLSL